MTTIALYHIKGGVGKTAASVNLSYLAAQEGSRTLLVDLDPQGAASFYFRMRPKKKFSNKQFMKGGKKIDKNIRGTDYENLDALPASLSFRKMDIALDSQTRTRNHLKIVLRQLKNSYDYLFLDSPPNITLVSENIFRACDILLVPVIPTTLSIMTYEKLLSFFKKKSLDESKIISFFSMVEKRKKMHQETLGSVSRNDPHFLGTVIPYAADVERMGIFREPVVSFRPRSVASLAYVSLWDELKKRRQEG